MVSALVAHVVFRILPRARGALVGRLVSSPAATAGGTQSLRRQSPGAPDGLLARQGSGPPRKRSRHLMRGAATLLLILGLALVAEVIVTVTWQEPFSALSARHKQKVLADRLDRAQASLPPATLAELGRLKTDRRRVAALAHRLERRAAPGDPLGRIAIPKIGASFVFVAGSGTESLKKGPGHYPDTALPGESGTVGIAGHRTTFLAPFRNIDRLRKGDEIVLRMPYGRFTYSVEGSIVVLPSNVAPLRRVHHGRLVLTTCTPLFSAAKRLVVTGRLLSVVPLGAAAAPSGRRTDVAHRTPLLGPAAQQLTR